MVKVIPWNTLCVDLIGPYTANLRGGQHTKLQCMAFIDPATGWFEITKIPNKKSSTLAKLLSTVWLSRYPLTSNWVMDNGTEFKKYFIQSLINTVLNRR